MGKYIKESLGQLVTRVLREKNLSLREVEERSGGQIERSYISRIVTGNVTNITLEKLTALARGLGEDAHTLFTAHFGAPPSSKHAALEVYEPGAEEFAAMMLKVASNPKLIEMVQEIVKLTSRDDCEAALAYLRDLAARKRKKPPQGKTTNQES